MRILILGGILFLVFTSACGSKSQTAAPQPAPQQPIGYAPTDPGYYYYEETTDSTTGSGGIAVIYSEDGQFLGWVSPDRMDPTSICNISGDYGNAYSQLSVKNGTGPYGNPYSTLSAYHQTTQTPPAIYYYDGSTLTFLDYLSKNVSLSPRVDPDAILSVMCQ